MTHTHTRPATVTEMDGARRHATAMMQCLFKCLAVKSHRNLEGVDGGSGRGKARRSALAAMEHRGQQGGNGDQFGLAGAVSGRDQGRRVPLFWMQLIVLQAGVCSSDSCANASRLGGEENWGGAAYLCSDGLEVTLLAEGQGSTSRSHVH